MSRSDNPTGVETEESVFREYVLDVRIVEERPPDGDPRYRFEAPQHEGITFDDPERAELYADVYFDVNGFQEAGTGDRGVPPRSSRPDRTRSPRTSSPSPGSTRTGWRRSTG